MKLVIIMYCKMEFSENNMSKNTNERKENEENRASENIRGEKTTAFTENPLVGAQLRNELHIHTYLQ